MLFRATARRTAKGTGGPRRSARERDAQPRKPGADWLFAYGSLLWERALGGERRPARLFGYHRSLCIYSHVYRGTARRPGLVLGLAKGGSCRGVVIRIPKRGRARWLSRIRARENITGVYSERLVEAHVPWANGGTRCVKALCFVADPAHRQFAGKLSRAKTLRCLRQGRGRKGRAADYLKDTVRHLRALGIRDRALERLAADIRK